MDFLNQNGIWIGIFSIISSVVTILATGWVKRKTKIQVEKMKMHNKKKFNAHLELYDFISKAFSFFPPNDEPRKEFCGLMRTYFTGVKKNYPYINKNVREKLKELETQYFCLSEPDCIPKLTFEEFYKNRYLKLLNELNDDIEKIFDNWERKL